MNKNSPSYTYMTLNAFAFAVLAYLIFMIVQLYLMESSLPPETTLPKINEKLYESVSNSLKLEAEITIDNTGRKDPFAEY